MKIPAYLATIRARRQSLTPDVPALLAEVKRLRAELAEAQEAREQAERWFLESQAEVEQLRQERDELAAALQRLNQLVGWWLRELTEVGE